MRCGMRYGDTPIIIVVVSADDVVRPAAPRPRSSNKRMAVTSTDPPYHFSLGSVRVDGANSTVLRAVVFSRLGLPLPPPSPSGSLRGCLLNRPSLCTFLTLRMHGAC